MGRTRTTTNNYIYLNQQLKRHIQLFRDEHGKINKTGRHYTVSHVSKSHGGLPQTNFGFKKIKFMDHM